MLAWVCVPKGIGRSQLTFASESVEAEDRDGNIYFTDVQTEWGLSFKYNNPKNGGTGFSVDFATLSHSSYPATPELAFGNSSNVLNISIPRSSDNSNFPSLSNKFQADGPNLLTFVGPNGFFWPPIANQGTVFKASLELSKKSLNDGNTLPINLDLRGALNSN